MRLWRAATLFLGIFNALATVFYKFEIDWILIQMKINIIHEIQSIMVTVVL